MTDRRLFQVPEAHSAGKGLESLTPRELRVLSGLIAGQSNETIARSLGISLRAVRNSRAAMMEKLGARSTADAVGIGLSAGLDRDQEPGS